MINKVILLGNLGQDPELRTTGGGTSVVNLRVATSDRRKDQSGEWVEHTEWHTVIAFGKTAENINQYCKKGKQLYIEGRLQTRKWEDKEGNPRYSTEVVAETVRFLGGRQEAGEEEAPAPPPSRGGGKPSGGQGGGNRQPARNTGNTGRRSQEEAMPYSNDDIPF